MLIVQKLILIVACFLVAVSAYAEPAPFGIKIKETSVNDVKSKYKFKDVGINKYSNGKMFDLEPAQFNFEGLKNVRVIFGEDDKVLAVLTSVQKSRYSDLLNMLSNKYELISKTDAFVGDRDAEFKDSNTKITLYAPHLSFDLELNYIHDDLHKHYIKQSSQDRQEKAKNEMDKI